MLGLPREKELFARGVHTCATCDGFFYKDKIAGVIGGGDSALEEALFLAKMASKVYIFHRREEFRASKIMQKRALENPKIEVVWNTELKKYLGDKMMNGVIAEDVNTKEKREIKLDGLFMAIGHIPNTEIFKGELELFESDYIKTNDIVKTSVDGIFAAGDCADQVYRQAITSAGTGCMAAMAAEKYIERL